MTSLPPNAGVHSLSPIEPLIPESDDELGDEITRLAAHINAAQYRFLRLLAALIERGAWGGWGIKSPAHWLNFRCGIGLNAAREKVRVAKALVSLPGISEAFGRGEISYSKVKAMARAATPANEGFLLNIARYGTAQHVELLVRKYRWVRRLEDSRQAASQYEAREFRWRYDDDGSLVFNGRLPPEEGAAFLKAMEEVTKRMDDRKMDEERRTGEPAESVTAETSLPETPPPTFAQQRADALVLMAEQCLNGLSGGLKPLKAADRFQVVVHMRHPREHVTAVTSSAPASTLEHEAHHFPLPEATARRLACDACVVPVLEDGTGNPLDIGRRTRLIPPSLRRALQLRDGTCRFPGCCEARWVDAHHVVHWCKGGETKLSNLVLLCRHHHRLLHQEGYAVSADGAGGFRFFQPDGEAMARALYPQFENPGVDPLTEELAIEAEHAGRGLNIDECTCVTRWCGEAMDYDWAIYVLRDTRERESAGTLH